MPQETLARSSFSRDIREFLSLLGKHKVRYVIVGGEAVIHYGYARLTGDIDIFYDRSEENACALHETLREFWTGSIPGNTTAVELCQEGIIIQFGVPPHRIDLVNRISGLTFSQAWSREKTVHLDTGRDRTPIHYIGLGDLIRNKRAAGRPKDLVDLNVLERIRKNP